MNIGGQEGPYLLRVDESGEVTQTGTEPNDASNRASEEITVACRYKAADRQFFDVWSESLVLVSQRLKERSALSDSV